MILALALAGSVAMPPPAGVPASCPVTAVERWSGASPSQYPFVRVQPLLTKMRFSFQAGTIGAPGSAYTPMHTRDTTVVWSVPGTTVSISGTTGDGRHTMSVVQPVLQDGRVLTFPAPGCWHLDIASGDQRGTAVIWVAP